ncbi:MAG: patatin-like phospholipase family protein [Betaproteobacteria bacterium]|nr:patatin-like phospholipase family protein [Betaproteobacteria bacterium]
MQHVHAQVPTGQTEIAAQKRPRIGLVLSGGGARGAAHIGVLKVLEEMRVPVDIIVGTSMGAIVGGTYSSGSSVTEMEQAIRGINTNVLFQDSLARQEQSMRRKQAEQQLPLFAAEIGLRDGAISLPKGAVVGIGLESVLRRLVKLKGTRDFDKLPIPFRAVATDVVDGEMVVFREGELSNAMRASMSVPGVVAPAEVDGRMLVDGGLVRNLPVDIAREMGADIIIAVNLGTPLLRRDQITSVVGISAQMIGILTEQNVKASLKQLKPDDILILPELGDFSAGDFDNLPKTIPIGEAATRKVAGKLAKYSLSPLQYAGLRSSQMADATISTRVVDEIRFPGLNRVNPEVLAHLVDSKVGEPIDQKRLDADLRRIYGRGDFEHVNYEVINDGGKRILEINATEKSWGPDYLRFGLSLSTDFSADSVFNLYASHRKTWVNSLGAEWRNDLVVGRIMRASTEFYQPLDVGQRFFVVPRLEVGQRYLDVFSVDTRVARLAARTTKAAVDLGGQWTKFSELRLGLERGFTDFRLDTGPVELAPGRDRFQLGAITGRLYFDQLDSPTFSRTGLAGSVNVFASRARLGASSQYTRWDGDISSATSYGRHALQFAAKAGGKLGDSELPNYDLFQWGGFLRQSGYRTDQLLGKEFKYGRAVYTYKLLEQKFLEGAYLGIAAEYTRFNHFLNLNQSDRLKSGALFLGFDSPLGPMFVAYGRAADGNQAGYFFLGRP